MRVVFDASATSSNGITLNDIVYKGPKLQKDIIDLIINFRLHTVVFTADISKMYRQMMIRPEDRHWQHILWREHPSEPMREYELSTITYGVSSSPFLAMRTLQQLAKDEGSKYPLAAEVVRHEVYMDDVLTGAESVERALVLKQQIIDLLGCGRFELRKWSSNCPEVLADIPEGHSQTPKHFSEEGEIVPTLKILGMTWEPSHDFFTYTSSDFEHNYTKRGILRNIARIWDPLGWLCPVVFIPKLLIQKLWRLQISWDDEIPPIIKEEWERFCGELEYLKLIKLPRPVIPNGAISFQLIGFCDGSSLGFGCAVYLRVETDETVHTSLLMAKSKVAPLKVQTINRLELCGAVLLSRVLHHIAKLLQKKISISEIIAFTDSTTVLAWLQTEPYKLKTFVAHRVVQITDTIPPSAWKHVPTLDNPADFCSRGMSCSKIAESSNWWSGPSWLTEPRESWPRLSSIEPSDNLPEMKGGAYTSITRAKTDEENIIELLMNRYSSMFKLQRAISWWHRYIDHLRNKRNPTVTSTLTTADLQRALRSIVIYIQKKNFSQEIEKLIENKSCIKSFQKLSPFIDEHGILRVGGRLKNSQMPNKAMFPILLPKNCRFSHLILDHFHVSHLHCGPRTLQSIISRQFWIFGIRNLIRSRLSRCVICTRAKPVPFQPQMGDLPPMRLQGNRCFDSVGIDFGGPFMVKESKRRNAKTYKAYICLFVCLSVKAIHIELVSELSTEAFVAALDRFVSRRGMVKEILTDCGTNFIGAKRHLNELYSTINTRNQELCNEFTKRSIVWKTNPPGSPHFGGIFESGIKSTKYHLKRVMGAQVLTYEELLTVLTKIEAILNSRPLCAISSDPNEVDILTAGHFLTGGPLCSLPEIQYGEENLCLRTRWNLVQRLTQSFWRVWSRDYLHTLQQRGKWFKSDTRRANQGDAVLIVDPNTSSLEWRLATVEKLHPGKDGIARVATLRTAKGTSLMRPLVKLCPLPIV